MVPIEKTELMHQPVPPSAWLVPKSGRRAGQQVPLRRGTNTIGRDPGCDLVLGSTKVSAEHCKIIFENGQFVIYDLASLNGTFVNGHRVQREVLADGDKVRLANSEFVFKKA